MITMTVMIMIVMIITCGNTVKYTKLHYFCFIAVKVAVGTSVTVSWLLSSAVAVGVWDRLWPLIS